MEQIKLHFKKYEIVELVTENDDVSIYKIKDKKRNYIYKKYRTSAPLLNEMERYTNLYKAGIRVPKMIEKNKKTNEVIFELFEGDHVDKVLMDNDLKLPDIYYERIFVIYRFCRFSKIELNYLPENFILRKNLLYYDCLEIYEQNPKINLENYGIYFWIKSKEAIKHLSTLGYDVKDIKPLEGGLEKKEIVLLSIKYW